MSDHIDAMATRQHHSTTRESIKKCNDSISRRFHVTLAVYKTIKATTQLLGVVAGIIALQQGADPLTTIVVIGGVIFGPEYMEMILTRDENREE
ncbi:hypothetical protein [Natrinema halophilum]|uniref:Uncharacterized protein n=1 Tax=Natrinema halophilum TaxID=1699371 RepID=A0A7D5GR65_9EURY|nr:hypothetical protein [Natrinema halophilum]QLG47906.1 hypothetical protein HYG82_03120 [Natrinema halophilum]